MAISESTPEPDATDPTLVVHDQAIRGGTVRIDSTNSPSWGFMTIHNQNAAGAFGPIIGWTPVKRGENRDILVKIDVKKATETLYAMLHVDEIPVGVLEFPGPDKPVMVMDQMLAQPFKATGGLWGTEVQISATSGESPHLVDGEGKSLYTSLNDSSGVSNCTGDCLKIWLPVQVTGRIIPGDGVNASKLGVLVLTNENRHVTYASLPLYYYIEDMEAGDTLGHGIDGLWFLATP
jgi:predicted lipoprotein with Yx(FWY)xxD motif